MDTTPAGTIRQSSILGLDGQPILITNEQEKETQAEAALLNPLTSKESEKLCRHLATKDVGYFVFVVDPKTKKIYSRTNIRKTSKDFIVESVKRAEFQD